jgi:hypothetical protein
MHPRITSVRRHVRSALLSCVPPLLLAACGGEPAPAAESAEAAAAAATEGKSGGRWTGEVTGGYKGNRISFVVADGGARIQDVAFEGHWDCSDGIEMTTQGPAGSHPVEGGRVKIVSVDPEGGGATATRFEMEGQLGSAKAEGTLRINLNALGCDTRVLHWSAAPAGV